MLSGAVSVLFGRFVELRGRKGLHVRVLVTGCDGYLGPIVTGRLLAAGYEVDGVDLGFFRSERDGPLPVVGRTADVRDLGPADLRGLDAVVHLAAVSNDPMSVLVPAATAEINHRAATALARAAREAGVGRFLFASTCSVYGGAGDAVVDEGTPGRPLTPYAEAKLRAEREIVALAGPRFTPVALRFGTAYGPSPRLRTDLVVNNLVAGALATGTVRLSSQGTAWRPLIHVDDIAEAYLAALRAPARRVTGQVVNVGADAGNSRVRDVAEQVVHAVPEARLVVAPGAGVDRRSYRVRFDRLARVLPQLPPHRSLADGVAGLVEAVRRSPVPPAELLGPPYDRVARLATLVREDRLTESLRRRTDAAVREAG